EFDIALADARKVLEEAVKEDLNPKQKRRRISDENRKLRIEILKAIKNKPRVKFGPKPQHQVDWDDSTEKVEGLWTPGNTDRRFPCLLLSQAIAVKGNIQLKQGRPDPHLKAAVAGTWNLFFQVLSDTPKDQSKGFEKDELLPGDQIWLHNPYYD